MRIFHAIASAPGTRAQTMSAPPSLSKVADPWKGAQTEIMLTTVDLDRAWRDHAGDAPADVMKVDVEDKWITPREPVDEVLGRAGLRFVKVVTEDPHCGVAFYLR